MSEASEQKDLPWWVELLFVQIGLPDIWLRTFLKTRKKAKFAIRDNKRTISYGLLLLLIMGYGYPVIKLSKYKNLCIKNSTDLIRKKFISRESLTKKEIQAIATSFCSGGNIN